MKKAAAILLALGIVGPISAYAHDYGHDRDFLARFEGGIGVIPVSNGAGPANPDGTFPNVKLNIVRGVRPWRRPWRIADLRADVDVNGRIKVPGARPAPGQQQQHRPERQSKRLRHVDL